MDYEQLASSILINLRGKFSQGHLSQKLGYKHNQIFKWETKERRIPWLAFTKLCSVKKIDLSKIIQENFRYSGDVTDAQCLLNYLIGKTEPKIVSKTLAISKYRFFGWLSGERLPYLDDMLKIFDCIEHRMSHFIVAVVGEKNSTEMGIDLTYVKFENFEANNPVFSAFLRLMETKSYKYAKKIEDGFFSEQLGINSAHEKSILKEALSLGLLQESNGKYKSKVANTDLRNSNTIIQQRRYWYQEAIKRLDSKKFSVPENIFGNLVYSATDKEQDLIIERYLSFFNDVRSIINSNDEPDGVYALNIQIIPLKR
jgi:hypothetical protein